MNTSFSKYIFIIAVIGIVILVCYTLYKQNEEKKAEPINENSVVTESATIVKDLKLGITNFDTINPILSFNKSVQEITKIVYEPLLEVTNDYKIQTCLAEEYSKTNNTSYLIKLKEGVKWHNGSIFTASDVQFTIDALKDENIQSIYKENLKNVTSTEIIDDYKIKINLNEEVPFFEYNLIFPIMCKNYYLDSDFVTTEKNNNPVGTGIYKIKRTEDGNFLLEQNQNYRDETRTLSIENIYVNLYPSMGEIYNAFKLGNIDLINTNNLNYEEYIGTIGFNKIEYKGRNYEFLALNNENELLNDVNIRKVIALSIDKQELIADVFANRAFATEFPLNNSNYLYSLAVETIEYNQNIAKGILFDNDWNFDRGWNKKINNKSYRLEFNLVVQASNEQRINIANNIKSILAQVGVDIKIKKVSDAEYNQYLINKNYDMIITGTTQGISPNLATYFGTNNLFNYKNEEMQSLITEVKNITNENLLKEKYDRIAQIYSEDVPFISLCNDKNIILYSSNLVGDVKPNWYSVFYNIEYWYKQY